MDKRLKDLIEQAGLSALLGNNWLYGEELEEFAELVLQNYASQKEPVAYADALDLAKDCNWDTFICKHSSENHEGTRFKIPLYTAPPKREWVGLTDDEKNNCLVEADPCEALATPEAQELMREVEAKLKEKNGD